MLVIFSGLPGTGKTSAAEELSRHLRAERLTTDELRQRVIQRLDASQKHKRSIYAALMEKAEKSLQQGKKVILDGTFFKRDMRQQAKELARRHDESFFLVYVTCPEEIVKKRLEKREREGKDASEADFRVYKIFQKQFEKIENPDYVMDTADENKWREEIKELASRIRKKEQDRRIAGSD